MTNRINNSYGTSIKIRKLDLSSIRNVEMKSILINDHHGDTLFAVGNLSTSILNYRNIFKTKLDFGDILIKDGTFNLKTYKNEDLNNLSIFVNKFKSDSSKSGNVFHMKSSSIQVENVDFTLFNENKKEEPIVFYKNIYGVFDDFLIEGSEVSARIKGLKTLENHEVLITNFNTNFKYTDTRMEFLQTELSTKRSNLNADIIFNYERGDLSVFTNKVQIEADFKKADVLLSDLKKLYGEFGKRDVIHFSAKAKGTINDFVLKDINLESDRLSSLRGTVAIKNVLNPLQFNLQGDIKELSSNYDHLVNLLPDLLGTKIPKELEKLGYFSSRGKVNISKSDIDIQLRTIAEMGMSVVDLKLIDIDKGGEASYKGKVELIDIRLGEYVRDSLIGEFSMIGEVEGKGFAIHDIRIRVKGQISKHQYRG